MFHAWLYPLAKDYQVFNLFRYITVRAFYAALTAFVLSLLLGPWLISLLRRLKVGQSIRDDGPATHQKKAGTPTMGGVLILGTVLFSCVLWSRWDNPYVWLSMGALLLFGAVGFVDDYNKLVLKNSKGLSAKSKIFWQAMVATFLLVTYLFLEPSMEKASVLNLPFVKVPFQWPVVLYACFAGLVMIGFSNGVNLTDGMDGLAVGNSAFVAIAFALICYLQGNARFAGYLYVPYVPELGEVAVVCAALLGACLGFLWFNAHPAQVFMGDTGSLALGGFFGIVAVLSKQEILLVLIGGVFVAEAMSVVLQVGSFKMRGKRIFRMAPIHHHFELQGVEESKLIVRFWIVAALLMVAALSTFKLR